MPYADDFQDDDEDLNNPQGPQLAGANQVVGGGQVQASTAPVAKGPSSSERFQNLNAYLDANQGNQFGQDFAGKVQSDVAKGGEAQAAATGQFQNLANSGAVVQNTQLVDEAVTDPTKFIGDQGKVDQFAKQRDAKYSGPNSFADAGDIYQKTYGATKSGLQAAEGAQTEEGRFALLDNYFGRPEYSQGQKSLDNLLVTGNDNATQGLAQARKNAQNQMSAFQAQDKDLGDYATQKKAETQKTKDYARAALGIDSSGALLQGSNGPPGSNAPSSPDKTIGPPVNRPGLDGAQIGTPTTAAPGPVKKTGVLSDLYAGLEDRATGLKANYQGQIDNITKALASKDLSKLTPEERDLLGITGLSGSINTFGVEASNYFEPKTLPGDISRSSVASREEAIKLQALAQLAGSDPKTLIDVSKAGGSIGKNLFKSKPFSDAIEVEVKKVASQPNSMVPTIAVNEGTGIEGIQTALAQGKIPTSIYPSDSAPGYIPGVSGLQQQKDWLANRVAYIEDGIKKGNAFKWDGAAPRPLLHGINKNGASMTPENASLYLSAVKKAIALSDAKLDKIRKGTLPNVSKLKYS